LRIFQTAPTFSLIAGLAMYMVPIPRASGTVPGLTQCREASCSQTTPLSDQRSTIRHPGNMKCCSEHCASQQMDIPVRYHSGYNLHHYTYTIFSRRSSSEN